MVSRNPHKPKILIFSSSEGLIVADAIKSQMEECGISVAVWNDGVLKPSEILINSLSRAVKEQDGVVIILSADDTLTKKGKKLSAPRDNLIFEAGLAVGILGIEKVFVLSGKADLAMPSDLQGVLYLPFEQVRSVETARASVAQPCAQLIKIIRSWSHTKESFLDWTLFEEGVGRLGEKVMAHSSRGGLRPHIVVGVNPGGSIIGGLLYLRYRRGFYFCTLWPDTEHVIPDSANSAVLRHWCEIISESPVRILLVDDSQKSGGAMRSARNIMANALRGIQYVTRSAVLVNRADLANGTRAEAPDYFVSIMHDNLPYAPV